MKVLYVVLGILAGAFAVAQLLQLLGLIGVGFSFVGVVLTVAGGLASLICFRKALSKG